MTNRHSTNPLTSFVSIGASDYWIRMQRPGGEPFEVSLLSLMEAAENMRRREQK